MSEWTDIGEQLRKARESKGLDLKDVSHTTRIPLATLAALEESDYSIFPSPTYARSFLSQYSEYLSVDAHEWVDAFETGDVLSNVNDHGYLQSHNEHIGDHRNQSESPRRRGRSPRRQDNDSSAKGSGGGSSILQTLTVFFVTALFIGGGIYAYKKFEPMLKGALSEEKDKDPADDDSQDTGSTSNDSSKDSDTTEPTEVKADSAKKPPLVATNTPPVTGGGTNGGTTPSGQTTDPATPTNPIITPPKRTGKPPKAMVIDEEEE